MKKTKQTKKISTIALILLLTMSVIVITLPAVTAQEVLRKKTYAIMGATPNPIGINQQVLLHFGITHQMTSAQYGWEDITVTVSKPDGSTETLGPFRTDATGGTGTLFVPSMVGTYTLQSHFPEQANPATVVWAGVVTPAGTIMEASDSEIVQLVVTQEQREYYPGQPLPTEYWGRPIDAQLREWSTISGNFLEGADRNDMWVIPYNDEVAETAHVLWAKTLQMGGLAGGATGNHAFECGDAYEGFFDGSVIIGGNLYYNNYKSGFPTQEVVAVNLHTGEELWRKPLLDPEGNSRRLSFGQVFYWDSYNYHAAFPYLWATSGSTWHAFDPFEGQWVYSMENVPSGSTVYGPKGEIYRINVNTNSATMRLWNSSRVVSDEGSWIRFGMGQIYNASEGIEWTVDIPEGLPGGANVIELGGLVTGVGGSRQYGFLQQRENSQDSVIGIEVTPTNVYSWGISLEPGHEGELLFNVTGNAPSVWTQNVTLAQGVVSPEDGVFTVWIPELRQHWGFSLTTAQRLWGPTEPQAYLDYLGGLAIRTAVYENMLISAQMSGTVYAYDLANGDLLWSYDATDPYTEILWGDNWPLRVDFFADGKIYITHSEHSPIDPKPRGAPFICLNATTGEVIWRIDGAFRGTDWGGNGILGDSIIATYDSYDQKIYAIGKGPSKTTVTVENNGIKLGSLAVLTGSVTDISPGTSDPLLMTRFPAGVPAVADQYMSEWMLYVYKQFSRPVDPVGVDVRIQVVDPNGGYAWIGTATTDSYGNYAYSFIPQLKGQYTIIATFAGSSSYFGSQQTTYLMVDSAPAPYPTVTIPPYPGYQGPTASEVAQNVVNSLPEGVSANDVAQEILTQMPEYPETPEYTTSDMIIIILVAVAIIVGLVSFLVLRKQK